MLSWTQLWTKIVQTHQFIMFYVCIHQLLKFIGVMLCHNSNHDKKKKVFSITVNVTITAPSLK